VKGKNSLMQLHLKLARALIRLGSFIQSSAVMVLSADDLVELSRRHYTKSGSVSDWNRDDLVESGLIPEEQHLIERLPSRTGRLLLLGLGGGREAIHFAKMGFEVTGVDFIPEMIKGAVANAERHNLHIHGIVQDIAALDMPAEYYDVVWLSAAMYSCVPTRARRVQMLRRVRNALKKDGFFACQFHWNERRQFSGKAEFLRRMLAWLTMGNLSYEKGDALWANVEFIHAFSSENDLQAEFADAGFHVIWLNAPRGLLMRGEALLQKREA
jgi:ubiquinone/menaquinone biosynthesis C-methylase UbiE